MSPNDVPTSSTPHASNNPLILVFAWIAVATPLLWGVAQTLKKALALFR